MAAPTSTIDLATPTGAEIPVEERSPEEVRSVGRYPPRPPGVAALNRAFDVTPAGLVTAIITELGVARPPYDKSLRRLVEAAPHRLPLRPVRPCRLGTVGLPRQDLTNSTVLSDRVGMAATRSPRRSPRSAAWGSGPSSVGLPSG